MPRLIHRALAASGQETIAESLARLAREQRRHTWLLVLLVLLITASFALLLQLRG
jgi:hypothetical protein